MIRIKKTGQVFENRKEAKITLGQAAYNRLVRNKQVEYLNNVEVKTHKTTDIIY
jgi:hypothetical protein